MAAGLLSIHTVTFGQSFGDSCSCHRHLGELLGHGNSNNSQHTLSGTDFNYSSFYKLHELSAGESCSLPSGELLLEQPRLLILTSGHLKVKH